MIIYFTGIDGSGKSTIMEHLVDDYFKGTNVLKIRGNYEHRIFKLFSKPFRKKIVKSSSNYNNITSKDYNKWKAFKLSLLKNKFLNHLFYSFQALDYYIQLIKIEKRHLSCNRNIIIDRFILDFLVYESIFYGDISNRWFTNVLIKKLKNVNVIIFLDTDPKNAYKRKDDIPSIEFLNERLRYYRLYSSKIDNFFSVSNNGEIKDTLSKIKKILSKYENNNIRN